MNRNNSGFVGAESIIAIIIVGIVGSVGIYTLHARKAAGDSNNFTKTANNSPRHEIGISTANRGLATTKDSTSQPDNPVNKSSNTTSTKPKVTASTPSTPTPAPTPAPNTTNCLPPNPSPYATYFIGKTNSQYLQTNSYANTTKLYAALQFAGLIDTINTKQYVVLAMDDSNWGSFTQTQLDWLNASPTNMRSVLGWQIITSCITWDGVNPVKNMASGATMTVNTVNGAVTFTSRATGLGTFGNGGVGIWDWFTSNGAVTIAGFVNKTSVP